MLRGSSPGPGSPKKHSRCSSAEERLYPDRRHFDPRGLTDGRLSAHNGEDVGSKPTTGIHFQFRRFTEPAGGIVAPPQQFTGMAQRLARGAHNSEVTRSKRVAGI